MNTTKTRTICPTCQAVDSIVDGRCTAFGTGCGYQAAPNTTSQAPTGPAECEFTYASRVFVGPPIDFPCGERATYKLTWLDLHLKGSPFERQDLLVCSVHHDGVFVELDSDDTQVNIESETL
jgi:hypothetical protein